MQAQLTFVRHNPKQCRGQNGPFTVHEFFTADNTKFETSKTDVANAAYALSFANGQPTNAPVLVTYEEIQNGQWTNRRMSEVQAMGAGGAMPNGVLPSGSSIVPAPTAAPAPAAAQVVGSAPVAGATGTRSPDHPDTAKRIARSVGLELALKAIGDGVVSIETKQELFDVAHEFGAYVFSGSRPSSAAAGADSSGVGGEGAGAAPAAPAPTQASSEFVPAGVVGQPTDDIPF